MKTLIKKYLLVLVVLAFICLAAPSARSETISHVVAIELAQKQIEEVTPAPPAITQVQLTVTAPFSTARLTIFSDGHMRYEAASSQNDIHENETKTISPEQFQILAELIRSSHLDTLEANYSDDKIVDATSLKINVEYAPIKEGTSASSLAVNCQAAACPQEINSIVAFIKKMWGKEILEIGI